MLARCDVSLVSIALYPIRRRLPNGRSRVDLRNGFTITAPASEPLLFLFREIWVDRCYDTGRLAIGPGDTVVDIGAHVGVFALWVAAREPRARIIAVEPSPRAAPYLRRNLARSGRSDVVVVESACGGQAGRAGLYARGPEMMNSLFAAGPRTRADPVDVSVITLDDLFERYDVRSCALLKLDCEGAEYGIILGARAETLARIRSIAMEYHRGIGDHVPEDLSRRLAACGFSVRLVPSATDPVHGYLYAVRSETADASDGATVR